MQLFVKNPDCITNLMNNIFKNSEIRFFYNSLDHVNGTVIHSFRWFEKSFAGIFK